MKSINKTFSQIMGWSALTVLSVPFSYFISSKFYAILKANEGHSNFILIIVPSVFAVIILLAGIPAFLNFRKSFGTTHALLLFISLALNSIIFLIAAKISKGMFDFYSGNGIVLLPGNRIFFGVVYTFWESPILAFIYSLLIAFLISYSTFRFNSIIKRDIFLACTISFFIVLIFAAYIGMYAPIFSHPY